jgi:hypothetical protein
VSECVAAALVVSKSVDDARFRLQMEGIAEALEDPSVFSAITGNAGGILIAMVIWADRPNLTRAGCGSPALPTRPPLRATPRQAGEFLCLGQMFPTFSAGVLPALPNAW